jgi:hypothetical protein
MAHNSPKLLIDFLGPLPITATQMGSLSVKISGVWAPLLRNSVKFFT